MVRRGSVGLNHPKLMSNSAAGMDDGVVLWFEPKDNSDEFGAVQLP